MVAPGAIETDFGGGAVRDNKQLNTMIAEGTALGRVGLPHDIGSVVAFLCSEDAKMDKRPTNRSFRWCYALKDF